MNVYELEIDCDRELLPSILVQELLNTILALSDDVRESEPTTTADNRIIHHFRPIIRGDADIFEQLLLFYEWLNGHDSRHQPHADLFIRMTIKIAPHNR